MANIDRLWLYQAERAWSKKNCESYTMLRLWDNVGGHTYITYVSFDNYNSQNWGDILDKHNSHRALCLQGDFKTKPKHPHIINADCHPEYCGAISMSDFTSLVYNAWKSELDPEITSDRYTDLNNYFS